jgi:hypothetical protein
MILPTEERRPAGTSRALTWAQPHRLGAAAHADVSDMLVVRPKPFRLVIWEPLITKAPSPALAAPWCCYRRTVIFYARPHVIWPYPKIYECRGRLRANSGPSFAEWDQIETRLSWDDALWFEGEIFVVGGGRVVWAPGPGGGYRRWWMCHGARRQRTGEGA